MKKYFFYILLVAFSLPMSAEKFEKDGLIYITGSSKWGTAQNGGTAFVNCIGTLSLEGRPFVSVSGCSSDSIKEISIPEKVTYEEVEYDVISINDKSFYNYTNLEKVIIPSSVVHIGAAAFNGTALYNNPEMYDNGMLIIDGCLIKFQVNDDIKQLDIPDNVRVIADLSCCGNTGERYALGAYGTNLTKVTFPENLTTIGEQAFFGSVALNNVELPKNLKFLGEQAFDSSPVTKVTLPDGLICLGAKAFSLGSSNSFDFYCYSSYVPEWYSFISKYGYDYKKVIVHVAESMAEEYSNAKIWMYFTIIEDITPVENIKQESASVSNKIMDNGNIYIHRDGRRYNLLGAEVR